MAVFMSEHSTNMIPNMCSFQSQPSQNLQRLLTCSQYPEWAHWGAKSIRKNMIIAGETTMIIGAILLGFSTALAQLLVERIVTGVGVDLDSTINRHAST